MRWSIVLAFIMMCGLARAQGLADRDLLDFAHLSEGSEVYPYDWIVALQSARFQAPFLADLEHRFGIAEGPGSRDYLMPWVGLTTAWSDAPPTEAEAHGTDRQERVRVIDGKKSIKMVGTNCALCHSTLMEVPGRKVYIPGAPAIVNVRGFFQDLARSTLATMAKQDRLTAFLEANQVADAPAKAEVIRKFFLRRLGEDTGHANLIDFAKHPKLAEIAGEEALALARLFDDRDKLFRGKHAIADSLELLLRTTHGFADGEDLGVLKARMEYFAALAVGTNPALSETEAGWGRTDAFGRISNLVARLEKPIDLTAPVSFPWLWGMRYEAEYHYGANTNAVLTRNIGQAVGLGALITDDAGNSTANLHNLYRLEQLSYAVQVPQWEKLFAGVPGMQVDHALADAGRPVFEHHCAPCHQSERHVGPKGTLFEYTLRPYEVVKTDPNYARNLAVPVGDRPLGPIVLGVTQKMRDAYFRKWNVSPEDQAKWEDRDARGTDFFRDTLLGAQIQAQTGADYGDVKPGLYYRSRNLSGVWATAPFLHNGSVPSIAALLRLEERPAKFAVGSHAYDPARLGYASEIPPGAPDDAIYDTSQTGNSNAGHEFGTQLPEADKRALIEYLKVLPPEPEMAWE